MSTARQNFGRVAPPAVGNKVPAISVVMATYNGLRFLPQQIGSLLADLHEADEVVVVDDASTDGSVLWLAECSDPRIRIVRHERNSGVLASFADGLSTACHDIIFLCDQDDIWITGKRDAFVSAFANDSGALVVISDAEIIDAEGKRVAPSFMATRRGFHHGLGSTLVRNRYLGCAMAVRRELVDVALPIPPSVPMHDMWLGALGSLRGRVIYLSQPWIRYRRHGGNASPSQRQGWWRMLRWRMALLNALVVRVARLSLGWTPQVRQDPRRQ